jgi:hypothetical protein
VALLADYPAPGDPVARHGFVLTPPTAIGQPFTVTVPHFDASGAHVFEVRRWSARGLTIPAEEDEVLVVIDDREEAWAAAWWPAAGDVALGRERPFDYGIVEALPTKSPTPQAGDRCTFKAAAGVFWDLVYTGEATYPWAKVGGPPLFNSGAGGSNATETFSATGCPSITTPAVKMEAIIDVGATSYNGTVNAYSQTGLKIGAAATEDFLTHHQPGAGGAAQHGGEANSIKKTLVASTALKTEIRQLGGGTAQVFSMWMKIDPIRLG